MTEPGTEITRATLTDEDIVSVQVGVTSLDQLAMLLANQGYTGNDDETDGILSLSVIQNKDELVGKPFMILRWRFNETDKYGDGGVFVSMEIAFETRDRNDNRIVSYGVLNDGSTGIRDQMIRLTERRKAEGKGDPFAVREARNGLRRSDYVTDVVNRETGEVESTNATTYYVQF
jgi:hypothetical protein